MTVPPTIQALLAARLDQLPPAERAVLERGSVEGQVFHRGAVAALAPDDPNVPSRSARARAEGARPARAPATLPGDDAFRFRHLLIRDAAYDALPKAARAELHERFADWLERARRRSGRARRDPRLPPRAGRALPRASSASLRRSSSVARPSVSLPPAAAQRAARICAPVPACCAVHCR